VVGGAEVGGALLQHESVDEVVLTGGKDTYNKIMWGNGPKTGQPKVSKPFRAELGSVNPYIIVPGVWTPSDIDSHAQMLVRNKLINNSHVCASPQVVITSKQWPQRQAFLDAVTKWFKQAAPIICYYPGSDKRYEEHRSHSTVPVTIIESTKQFDNQTFPLFIPNAGDQQFGHDCEAFAPVLYEVCLDVEPNTPSFLPAAVEYANTKCDGQLTGTIIIDSVSMQTHAGVLDKAVHDLKVGSIGINQCALTLVFFAACPWGAYPGNKPENIGSGMGTIGNCLGITNICKSVLRGPFVYPAQLKVLPKARAGHADQRLTQYLIDQSYFNLTKLVVNVVTGL
jgi:aldehyde dehydrogenase (NAD(P)+)